MKKVAVISTTVVILAVVLAILIFSGSGSDTEKKASVSTVGTSSPGTTDSDQENQPDNTQTGGGETDTTANIIEMSSSGFSPNTLTISAGEIVTFTNVGTSNIWPASAVHPTHKVYPGSDIDKCGTSEEANIFDACRGINPGESYSFTFNQVGTWRYHDHLKVGSTGTIIVS